MSALATLKAQLIGRPPGWVFTPKDFSPDIGRASLDQALLALVRDKTIRRIGRGVYDLPKISRLLAQPLSPDPEQVSAALARRYGWTIHPDGPTALHALGLSEQVPAAFAYMSSGPTRTLEVGGREYRFTHRAQKHMGITHAAAALLVQALKALGRDRVDDATLAKLRATFGAQDKAAILANTRLVEDWMLACIRTICKEAA